MTEREDLMGGVFLGVLISLVIGIVIVFIFNPMFSSIIFILSLATLPGFFIMTLIYTFKLSKEKTSGLTKKEKFDWGIEVNLRRLQILHNKYSAMFQTAGIIATGSFLGMVYIGSKFPIWTTGNKILFPITSLIFIFSLHLAFRWWFAMREGAKFLKLEKLPV